MTEPDDKTKALIEAAKEVAYYNKCVGERGDIYDDLDKALAAFDPEPEMVYVIPELRPTEFETMFRARGFDLYHLALDDLWAALRELTRVPKHKLTSL